MNRLKQGIIIGVSVIIVYDNWDSPLRMAVCWVTWVGVFLVTDWVMGKVKRA